MAGTRFDEHSRTQLPMGYERLDGRLHFSVDPSNGANQCIVDLDLAPRQADGTVAFTSDLVLLRPADGSGRKLLVDVLNRGRRTVLRAFNRAAAEANPSPEMDLGDGFLMQRRYTVAFLGWQWDVVRSDSLLGLDPPFVQGVEGDIVVQFQPNAHETDHLLADRIHHPYQAADPAQPDATMTVRDWQDGPRSLIPRASWRIHDDGARVSLNGGFEAGRVYEVVYRTRTCPVVGTGLLAVRDCAAFLRQAGQIDHAFVYGVSQSGRFLRHFLSLGLNVDEADRQVYDGVLPHVAGGRRGQFNHRFAQPSDQATRSFGHLPPHHGEELLARQRAVGGMPRVIATNSSAEYWRGDCSLIHTDAAGGADREPAAEERVYHFAGTQHSAGALPLTRVSAADGASGLNAFNTVDYSPLLRAALVNLERWAIDGVEPPGSAFPRIADGTAATAADVFEHLSSLPGVDLPELGLLPRLPAVDLGPDAARGIGRYPTATGAFVPTRVAALDADGNELGGIRLPDLTVPLGTHLGWNPRDTATGGSGQIIPMQGSTLPFPATRVERERSGDPRPSIEERYRDRDDYLARVRVEAESLAAARYVLASDVDLLVSLAAQRYDAFAPVPVPA